MLREGSKNLGLARIDFLLLWREAVPFGDTVWCLGHLRAFRNNPCLDLVLKIALPENIPALIKLSFVFVNPFLAHMMRRVGTG